MLDTRSRRRVRWLVLTLLVAVSATAVGLSTAPTASARTTTLANSPIQHVVVIFQENHSFDETLGAYCQTRATPCNGYVGNVTLKNGNVVAMRHSPDLVPFVDHTVASQQAAVDGGAMDGWAHIDGCTRKQHYGCLTYYTASNIPNLTTLADQFVVSDATFSMANSPSWGGHVYAAASTLDGFDGSNPQPATGVAAGPGWGCDSNQVTPWIDPRTRVPQLVPSCVPLPDGSGAFESTPVPHVPTIFDELGAAGLPWKIYGAQKPTPPQGGGYYRWSICPSFADCLETTQVQNLVPSTNVLSDAAAGTLPSYSVVTPSLEGAHVVRGNPSQHNLTSMAAGDNWIGDVVSAIENGPDWNSTAIFITYDDCGCFYDHVPPGHNPDGTAQGIRVPMVIVSPYAVPGATDSTPATFASVLGFAEQTLGLPALSVNDANSYDYANSFNFGQNPVPPVRMIQGAIPAGTTAYLKAHPQDADAAADDDT